MKFLPVFLALVLVGCGKPLPVPPPHAAPQTSRASGLSAEEFDLQNRVACSLKGFDAGTPAFEACLQDEATS
jgi:hypothetical protein